MKMGYELIVFWKQYVFADKMLVKHKDSFFYLKAHSELLP